VDGIIILQFLLQKTV